MDTDISKYEEYVEKIVKIINEKGVVGSAYGETGPDGSVVYGMMVTEDPNSSFRATMGLPNPEEMSGEYSDAETYANEMLKELSEKESPVRLARRELEEKFYADIKDLIVPCIMNREKYRGYLKNVPNRVYRDLAVAYVFKGAKTSLTITNAIAEKLGITEEKLYEDSVKNIVPKGPVSITNILSEAEFKAKGIAIPEADGTQITPLYVISDNDMMFGANAILLPDFLKEVSEKLNGDFYIIAANRSFLFVIPRSDDMLDWDKMRNLVNAASEMLSDQTGLLTERVYSYSS